LGAILSMFLRGYLIVIDPKLSNILVTT